MIDTHTAALDAYEAARSVKSVAMMKQIQLDEAWWWKTKGPCDGDHCTYRRPCPTHGIEMYAFEGIMIEKIVAHKALLADNAAIVALLADAAPESA